MAKDATDAFAVRDLAAESALSRYHSLPIRKGGLLLFALLVLVVLGYFYWQVRQLNRTFLDHAREHSRMLAGVIERNARNTLLAETAIEEVIQAFLGNTARFLAYLDSIQPFTEEELTEFAIENGLSGIRVTREDGSSTDGPPGWLHGAEAGPDFPANNLRHDPDARLFLMAVPRDNGNGRIITGLSSAPLDRLREGIGMDRLLAALSGMGGVRFVRLEPGVFPENREGSEENSRETTVEITEQSGDRLAVVHLPLGEDLLVVGLETRHFVDRTGQLWQEFAVFSGLLIAVGLFFSWILNRSQRRYLAHIRDVERRLARQREDAALGRAAASITHEIRNPLNAIGMGLQRLQMEAEELDNDHRAMIGEMRTALSRTNEIVENIRRYAKPPSPQKRRMKLAETLRHLLSLYQPGMEAARIRLETDIRGEGEIDGDPQLIAQALENLVKNSVEAQPNGGFIRISLKNGDGVVELTIENGGFTLSEADVRKIMEPYFTTKTRGTGLGLAIARKIVAAHGGEMGVGVPRAGVLRVGVSLRGNPSEPMNRL